MEDTRPRTEIANNERRAFRSGTARGRLVPANMGALLLTAGTRYFPNLSDAILVLEDDEVETPATIDRYMTQLRHLGVFQKARGLVMGRFPTSVGMSQGALDDILERSLAGTSLPVMTGFEIGHVDPIATIPMGVRGTLNADAKSLSVDESAVKQSTPRKKGAL